LHVEVALSEPVQSNEHGGTELRPMLRRKRRMKTSALTWMAVAGMMATSTPTTKAGDREWAVAGKVLTGVAVGSILTRAFCEPPPPPPPTVVVYTAPPAPVVVTTPTVTYAQPAATVVAQPTVVYAQPAPTVVYAQPTVVYAPAPVVYRPYYYEPLFSVRVGFGGGPGWHHPGPGHGRGRW
jgi:hypothetical protein